MVAPEIVVSDRAGTLFVVSTPIGNVADLSPRAEETLRTADQVVCEDTRHTGRLLERLGIRARLVSHHEHNEAATTPGLVGALVDGRTLALVTDAGTPSVSDPGYRLVVAAVEAGVRVVPVPGPSAALAALAASGLPTDRFCFIGYLPPRRIRRRRVLEEFGALHATLIVYEAPPRLAKTLGDLVAALGDRPAVLARELTKRHEEFVRGRLSELVTWAETERVRGELTIVVAGARDEADDDPTFHGEALATYERLLAEGLSPAEARARTREVFG